MTRLAGKRIAVIGAGSIGPGWGNGKAAAVTFARHGAHVLCVDRDETAADATAQIIRSEGGSVVVLGADVTNADTADKVLGTAQSAWDGLDVLHYNVGISSQGGVVETADEDWARVFDINLTGAMRLSRAVLPAMRAQGAGVLTFVSSLAAVYSGPYSYVSYEASKAALCRFARSLAKENAPFGIRTNSILPGVIETPHVNAVVSPGSDPNEVARQRAAMVPMGRQGTAWDVANAALFLASDEAAFITGIELKVDGGLSC
ncbi:MAG: SDR family NAD(P)-dependent oxidoreductase [Sedimentitalea sp.]